MHAAERQATRRGARTDRCPRRLNRKRKKATGLDVSGIIEGAQRKPLWDLWLTLPDYVD
jgi:hypothetical protein